MDFQSLFLSPTGRISRQEFWIGVLILFAVGFVAVWIPVIGHFYHLASIYFWVCVYAKRLHDMGKTALLLLLPYGVSFLCVIAAIVMGGFAFFTSEMAGNQHPDAGATMATLGGAIFALGFAGLVGFIFMLWVGLTPGQVGDNKYGAPPHPHGAPMVPPLGAGPTPETPAAPPYTPPSEPPAA